MYVFMFAAQLGWLGAVRSPATCLDYDKQNIVSRVLSDNVYGVRFGKASHAGRHSIGKASSYAQPVFGGVRERGPRARALVSEPVRDGVPRLGARPG